MITLLLSLIYGNVFNFLLTLILKHVKDFKGYFITSEGTNFVDLNFKCSIMSRVTLVQANEVVTFLFIMYSSRDLYQPI